MEIFLTMVLVTIISLVLVSDLCDKLNIQFFILVFVVWGIGCFISCLVFIYEKISSRRRQQASKKKSGESVVSCDSQSELTGDE